VGRHRSPRGPDSDEWVTLLTSSGRQRDAALTLLHELLLRIARAELHRRSGRIEISGKELDDLAHQAAADAMIAVIGKLDQFRGESRFTTWAYKFVIFEVSTKLGRHYWRIRSAPLDDDRAARIPAAFGFQPESHAQWRDLVEALRTAVYRDLTDHQRAVFDAAVLNSVPLDAVAVSMGRSRNAVYKTLYDARQRLRASLVASGHLETGPDSRPVRGRDALQQFLRTDPQDVGCDKAMAILHIYVDLVNADIDAAERYPGVAAHLRECGPCGEDFDGLLAEVTGHPDR
jgi:RNA polymerase sigma-70 factor (ECF subfamily)